MKKSRLTNLFSCFEPEDWKKFLKYLKVTSKTNGEILRITFFFEKQINKTHIEFIDTETLRTTSKSTLNKQSFANAINTLCNEIERYFVAQELETDSLLYESIVLKTLAKRGLADNFYKRKDGIINLPYKHELWLDYHQFLVFHYEYFYNINKQKYESGLVVDQAFDKLKTFIANIAHFYSLEMHNRSVIIGEDWDEQIMHSNQLMILDTKLSDIFDQLILLKTEKKESAYTFLKQFLLKPDEASSKEIQNAIYIHLSSFLNHKIKNGQTARIPELLELYEIGFEKDIINFAGQISIRQFLNIINTACELDAFKWVEGFLKKWITAIDLNYRAEVLNLSMANISFAKKDFEHVIASLKTIKLKVFDHEYRVKWLQLMSMYELDPFDFDNLINEIRNFKYFASVNENRLEKTTFEAINNSLNFLGKLINNNIKNRDIELFKSEAAFIRKNWLLEKSLSTGIKI